MNWTEALTACGFRGGPRKENYCLERGELYWTVTVIPLWPDDKRFMASLTQGDGSDPHRQEMARVESDTANDAFRRLLLEKVGPGEVSVFAFIGAERTAKSVIGAMVVGARLADALRAVKENQGDEPARKQPDPNVVEWIKQRLS
jgi:hypothetical protein